MSRLRFAPLDMTNGRPLHENWSHTQGPAAKGKSVPDKGLSVAPGGREESDFTFGISRNKQPHLASYIHATCGRRLQVEQQIVNGLFGGVRSMRHVRAFARRRASATRLCPASEDHSPCETKPTESAEAVCSVPQTVGAGFKPARTANQGGAPCGVTTNRVECAKQSQIPAEELCETKPILLGE